MYDLFPPALLDLLPPKSRTKALRLSDERAAAHAAVSAASDRLFAAHDELQRLEGQIKFKLDQLRWHGKTYEEDRERIEAPLAPKREEIRRLQETNRREQEAWERHAFLDDARSWLSDRRHDGSKFRHLALAAPKTRNPVDAVEAIRKELAELDERWREVEGAPCPTSDLRVRALAALNEIADRGRLEVSHRARFGDPLRLAEHSRVAMNGSVVVGDPFALVAALFRKELTEKIDLLIGDTEAPGAISTDDRDTEFGRIAERRLDLERSEEALIVVAEANGQSIPRRRDADPRAVLEIEEIA